MVRKILLLLFIFISTITLYAQEQDERLALETIARINEWRIAEGTWPLKINPTLTDMAISHATYLASLDELPENLHAGPTGLNPRERALLDPFVWPHYQLPEQISVGENAGIGTLDYAMNFWENSDIHRSTSLNPSYREIGVAALPFRNGHLFIVVFGGRPNILPALLDPRDGESIYLSNEVFEYAEFFDSVHSVIEIQIFNENGEPLFDEPQEWTPVLTIPEGAGDTVYLLLRDGEREVLSRVNRDTDQVIVLSSLTDPEEDEPEDTEIVIDEPAEDEPEDSDTTSDSSDADTADEVTPEPTAVPTVEPTPEPANDQPDILILYTPTTLDVLNVSGANANWSNMELRGVVTIPFTRFTQFTDLDLSIVADRHCVQIRSNDVSGDIVKPESCRWVRSLVQVQPDRLFWIASDFELYQNGVLVGSCQMDQNVCEIKFD